MTNFVQSILFGLTIGGILYIISIGLSLTFGAMGIVNFAHGLIYAVGAYALYTVATLLGTGFIAGVLAALAVSIPLSYVIERFVIRRLYGQSIDYAIIATYAILLIGADLLKWVYGASPLPISDPIGVLWTFGSLSMPVFRLVIIGSSVLIFFGLQLFFKKTLVGKIVVAGLQDREAVRSLGINVEKHFAIVFVMGSALAALGGVLYAPLSTLDPYMGFQILILCFAVVIVGGMGNLKGTAVAAFALGMVHALTAAYIASSASDAMVYVVMAAVLVFRPVEA
ncbi:MAG TPA: branched-chain amino acid ABC transporter permease [Desulfomonilaceae bacterium]|nr:branched-chain amino acid ABC transporter permease [Desulfomonilaceae bacterium]